MGKPWPKTSPNILTPESRAFVTPEWKAGWTPADTQGAVKLFMWLILRHDDMVWWGGE